MGSSGTAPDMQWTGNKNDDVDDNDESDDGTNTFLHGSDFDNSESGSIQIFCVVLPVADAFLKVKGFGYRCREIYINI